MTPQPPRTVDLFVSGRWQPPQAGQYEPATSPVTGELTPSRPCPRSGRSCCPAWPSDRPQAMPAAAAQRRPGIAAGSGWPPV
jgi:hypothetical protein